GKGNSARSATSVLSRRIWLWTSLIVFLIVAFVFAVTEGLGDGNVLKLLGHPSFSILALLVALEAKPRTALFVGLGYGFHSLVNVLLGTLSGWVRGVAYVLTIGLILVFDLWVLSLWYPSILKKR